LFIISSLSSLAADTSPIPRRTGLVNSWVTPDVARRTGLVDSGIYPDPGPDVARCTGLIDSRIPPDIACGTGLVDPSVTRVHRTGQRGDHRTDNNNSQHEKPCTSQPVGSIVVHVLFSFLWLILLY
jgi:hypothetical protein